MKLGAFIAHGGLIIDGLVSIVEEDQATTLINNIVGRLKLDQCRALLTELDKVEHEQETAASILTRQKKWRTRHLLTVDGFKGYLDEVEEAKSLNPYGRTSKFFSQQSDDCLQRQIDLKAKVAARAYRLAAGSSAKSWNDLVPVYLKTVPKVKFLPSDVDQ